MSEELVEGVDYTIDPETGFLVFTREYLLRRGYCCENSCRHCPYQNSRLKVEAEPKEDLDDD